MLPLKIHIKHRTTLQIYKITLFFQENTISSTDSLLASVGLWLALQAMNQRAGFGERERFLMGALVPMIDALM